MEKQITKVKWFWAWDDEKEEAWLRSMAQNGLHMDSIAFPCVYTFREGVPADISYRMDFFNHNQSREEYLQLFQDSGWEHVVEYGSWQYFRKENRPGRVEEIYTDNPSKVQKYRRVLTFLVIFLPIFIFLFNGMIDDVGIFFDILKFLWFTLIGLYIYSIAMLLRRISQLGKKP